MNPTAEIHRLARCAIAIPALCGWLVAPAADAFVVPDIPTAKPVGTPEPTRDDAGAAVAPASDQDDEGGGIEILNGVAASIDYQYGWQDVRGTLADVPGRPTVDSEIDLHTTSLRIEYVLANVLSLYGIGARHDGNSKSDFGSVNLDGWGFGAGFTLSAARPDPIYLWDDKIDVTPLGNFDFNYTYNDFHDIRNGVHAYNPSARVGTFIRHRLAPGTFLNKIALIPFAGASYIDQTSLQRVDTSGVAVPTRVSPDDPWSGVCGLIFAYVPLGLRPAAHFLIEGGIGDRDYVLFSIRTEWLPKEARLR